MLRYYKLQCKFHRALSISIVLSSSLLAQMAERRLDENHIERWAVSGFLENGERAYVLISGQKIESISAEKPLIAETKILETQDWIAPSFIDLHNHLSYNVIPLWENARGQFDNRFEWRDEKVKNLVGYKDATSLQLIPFNPRAAAHNTPEKKAAAERAQCAAIRWAEIRALLGGAAVTQGFNNESMTLDRTRHSCSASYLVANVEVQSDLPGLPPLDSKTDIVDDVAAWGVNHPQVFPLMDREGLSYEEAVKRILEQEGLFKWIEDFETYPRSVANGLRLALSNELPSEWTWLANFEDALNPPSREVFRNHSADIYQYFTEVKRYPVQTPEDPSRPDNIDHIVSAVELWIYGPVQNSSDSFLLSKPTQSEAYQQLGRAAFAGGIHRLRRVISAFAADFYDYVYLRLLKDRAQGDFRMIAHLAEGNPRHPFTRTEFKDVVKMGLAFEKSIFIHGMGVDESDLSYAHEHNISFVWSPLSNLLLYGETSNIPLFIQKGVNFTLAPDWIPSGSKSLLYELKVARALFDKWIAQGKITAFSNKDLVALATVNPAKALSMENLLGVVQPGAYANLLIVKKQSTNMYDDILAATENDLKLTVISGQPRSGETEWMSQLLAEYSANLETLEDFSPNKCVQNKSVFLVDTNVLDQNLQNQSLDSLREISKTVTTAREDQRRNTSHTVTRAKLKNIDPLFDCDSPEARLRITDIIKDALPGTSETLAAQLQRRKNIRHDPAQFLGDQWTSQYYKAPDEPEGQSPTPSD